MQKKYIKRSDELNLTDKEYEELSKETNKLLLKYKKDLNLFIKDKSKFNIIKTGNFDETLSQAKIAFNDLNLDNLFLDKFILQGEVIEDILFINDEKYLMIFSYNIGVVTFVSKEDLNYHVHLPFAEPRNREEFISVCDMVKSITLSYVNLFNKIANQEKEFIQVNRKVIGKKKNRPVYQNYYSINIEDLKRYDYGKDYSPQRKNQRHIDSWEVRGHYRTLKSGKVVWVRPSVKGNKNKESKKQTYERKGE